MDEHAIECLLVVVIQRGQALTVLCQQQQRRVKPQEGTLAAPLIVDGEGVAGLVVQGGRQQHALPHTQLGHDPDGAAQDAVHDLRVLGCAAWARMPCGFEAPAAPWQPLQGAEHDAGVFLPFKLELGQALGAPHQGHKRLGHVLQAASVAVHREHQLLHILWHLLEVHADGLVEAVAFSVQVIPAVLHTGGLHVIVPDDVHDFQGAVRLALGRQHAAGSIQVHWAGGGPAQAHSERCGIWRQAGPLPLVHLEGLVACEGALPQHDLVNVRVHTDGTQFLQGVSEVSPWQWRLVLLPHPAA